MFLSRAMLCGAKKACARFGELLATGGCVFCVEYMLGETSRDCAT